MTRRTTCVFLLALAVPGLAAAQTDTCLDATTQTFDAWLNCRIEHVLAAAGGPAGSEKQAETPSVSQDSPSLVDTTSASDFVGFGLTLLGLRNAPANSSDVSSGATSITATAFALLAAAYGKDPLADSDFYYGHPDWRRVSFTVGRQPAREDGQGFNGEATIAGVKLLLLDLREVAKHENLTDVQNAVTAAALGYGNIKAAVQDTLRVAAEPTSDAEKFVTSLTNFRGVLTKAAAIPNLGRQIDEVISARIRAQADLQEAITAKLEEVKRRPQISLAWSSNLRGAAAPDQHRVAVVVDYGMAPRLSVTANAGIDLIDRKALTLPAGTATSVGRIAAAMRLALADAGALGLRPAPTMSLSTDIQWRSSDATYKAQWKFDLPVSGGIVIPISLTWANRTELIKEKDVRGTIGFTIDTSRLAASLR
jgi:hypothetical protein